MQNRYTGDIGDYVKYGLLRALTGKRRLGVAWYLFPDEGHNEDGRHVTYLSDPDRWRFHDPQLYDALEQIVKTGRRTVAAIEKSGILGAAGFASEALSAVEITFSRRRDWRHEWFERVRTALSNCDIVFADPDNGLCEDDKFEAGRMKDWKRIPVREARDLADGRTAVIYHHNTRRAGGHEKEIEWWIDQLGDGTRALRWRAFGSRTFFIVHPAVETDEVLKRFAVEWAPHTELYGW